MTYDHTMDEMIFRSCFDLIMRQGLSPNESICYVLVHLCNIFPSEASDVILNMTGRRINPKSVSNFCYKASIKLQK